MKYWISITIYLWKNIWNRWFESPLSAWSKILLTFLLSLLALTLVGAMRQTETILKDRLSQSDILTAKITIHSQGMDGKVALEDSIYREAILKRLMESDNVEFLRRPFASAKYDEKQRVPIIVPYGEPCFWESAWGDFSQPGLYLMSRKGTAPPLDITLQDIPLELKSIPLPKNLENLRGEDHIILMPYAAGYMLLEKGFSEFLVLQASDLNHLRFCLKRIEAYLQAEGIRYSLDSSLKILEELQKFTEVLSYVRVGLVILLIIIISIVLGNQAVLEFREQQYHYALLRSFGVPYFLIVIHDLGEKVILAALGCVGAYYSLPYLEKYATGLVKQSGNLNFILLPIDLIWIGGGVMIGVLLSWLFLMATSRKAIGLVLS